MPDLYAINLHLQERLERDWRDDVRAPEAARWLDNAGLLTDRRGGLPLRNLLRAGRIAGQEQRSDKKNGTWFIRRLAASRDPNAIRDARERLRRCLPIDRDALPPDWPVNQGPAVFWQELGKTVAAFGYLEHNLASTCLRAPRDRREGGRPSRSERPCSHAPVDQATPELPDRQLAPPHPRTRPGPGRIRPGSPRRSRGSRRAPR